MIKNWLLLGVSIAGEVIATSALNLSAAAPWPWQPG